MSTGQSAGTILAILVAVYIIINVLNGGGGDDGEAGS